MIEVLFLVGANVSLVQYSSPALGPPSLQSCGCQRHFPWMQNVRGMKLTTQPHLVPRTSMYGAALLSLIRLHGVIIKYTEINAFLPYHSVQTGSRAHPASYPLDTRCCFPRVNAAGS
jgi:hypothetical protein